MVISHKYKFIFIKTTKVGGTSLELMLDELCGPADVFPPHWHPEEGHRPRNFNGWFNPLPELFKVLRHEHRLPKAYREWVLKMFNERERFHESLPAWQMKRRLPSHIWNGYYKFTIERNPWDKAISRYYHSKGVFEPKYGKVLTMDGWLDYFEKRISQPWVTKAWGSEAPLNYTRYADPWTDELLVDKICRYEELDQELKEVFERVGMPWPGTVPRKAKTGYRVDRRPYQEVLNSSQRDRIAKACAKEIALMGYTF
ncbi:MAG: sulfotransferase family 2 domain-containing protein [Flavobacteriales bacterium]